MKSTFIMTVSGPESLGIIKSLAHTTHELDGEWIQSKVMKLEGQFTAIIKVAAEADKIENLKKGLSSQFTALNFSYNDVVAESDSALKVISVNIDCKDRPAMIKDLNSLMLNLGLKVVHMESHRFEVAEIGATVFSAKLDIEVPTTTSAENVVDEIEAIDEEMRVSVI